MIMFSKDPSELTRKDKMDNEEIGRAIRLSLAAELDAINFYMQQSKIMPDGSFKAVHEDIAKEEVTHFGEFMRLLYEYAPADFAKIKAGWNEASSLLSSSNTVLDFIDQASGRAEGKKSDSSAFGGLKNKCRIVDWNEVSIPLSGDGSKVARFKAITHEYTVKRGIVSIYKKEEERLTQRRFSKKIEDYFFEDSPISLFKSATAMNGTNWSKPGSIAEDVFRAHSTLAESFHDHDLVLLVSQDTYPLLLRTLDHSGETELHSVRKMVDHIEICRSLRGKKIVLYDMESLYLLVRSQPETILLEETATESRYAITAEISPLLLSKDSAISISLGS